MTRRILLSLVALLPLAACGSGTKPAAAPEQPAAAVPAVPSDLPGPTAKAAGPTHSAAPKAKAPAKPLVVGFGDSVPAGAGGCNCVNFVSAYATMIGKDTGVKPDVDNFAVSGSTSADLLDQLSDSSIRSAIGRATTILIMTGANDYNDAFDQASVGAATSKLYPPVATAVQDNVTAAINKIQDLNSTAHIVLLDYWASMEDGAVAKKDYDATAMAASIACTTSTNAALAVAAKATGATYVSTYAAFKGTAGTKDDTSLLQPDGDHPDPAGHQVIAAAITAVYPRG